MIKTLIVGVFTTAKIIISKNKLIMAIAEKKRMKAVVDEVAIKIHGRKYLIIGDLVEACLWKNRIKDVISKEPERCLVEAEIEATFAYLNNDDFCVVITPCNNVMSIVEKLIDCGIAKEQIIIATKGGRPGFGGKLLDCYDVSLGFSRIDDLPGFVVFGKENLYERTANGSYVSIVTLGGSTTDPYFANFRSWSEILYTKLTAIGVRSVIYCGGVCSYTSAQELQKLIKDVVLLKPDIVISYSGANDQANWLAEEGIINHPYVRKFHYNCFEQLLKKTSNKRLTWYTDIYNADKLTCGLEDHRLSSDFWIENEQMMSGVCNELGIKFYGFLQPSPEVGGYVKDDFIEYSASSGYTGYSDEIQKWYKDAKARIDTLEYMYDLSDIFSGMSGVYFDECHVFEKGNRLIAESIFRTIIKYVRTIKMEKGI